MEVSSIASPPYTCFAVQSQNRLIISQRAQRKKLIIPTCCINGNGAISASKNTLSCAFDQHNIEYYTSRGLYATLPVFGDNTSFPIYGSKSTVSITGRKKTRLMSCEAHSTGKKALLDSGITSQEMGELDKSRCGVIIGTALGGMAVSTEAVEALRVSYRKINPFTVPFATANMGSAILAIDLGWTGPNYSISTACATSNFCILNAAQHIISDDADMMLCGGSDAGVIPISIGGFISCRLLSRQNDEPTKASRPWDTNRDGFVMGEGAGVLLLEELEHAKKRGATIYAELLGGSFTCNAFRTDDSGKEISLCMERALAQSGVAPEDVNYINAHAISSPASDIKEIRAINRCFGKNPNLRVNSTKSMIGHLLGAAGAVEAVATVKAIQTGLVHPNINLDNPDEGVDMNVLVGKKKERLDIKVALSNSLAFGGQNSSLVFAPYYK
ncbi:hypothetical protein CsatB_012426 [Cannabis sativa]